MDYNALLAKIAEKIKRTPSVEAWNDFSAVCVEAVKEDVQTTLPWLKWASEGLESYIPALLKEDIHQARQMMDIHKRILLAAAKWDFESFLLFAEWNRDPRKKFYQPRRKALHTVVEAMQDLADDKLDLLAVSLPPGTGKSTLAIFYLCWMAGKYPDDPILTGSHSNSWVRGAYDECLRILDPNGDYLWAEVFADTGGVTNTNAKDCRIDLGKRKRFETLEFTSIGTGNAGLYRAATLLYCDDLVSGIEVALSEERLQKLWEVYTTDLRQRKIGYKCKELHIATRWSTRDIVGRLINEYEDSNRAKFIAVPALDDNDESNFDYAYGVGFSTKFYREQRDIMDEVSWKAIYMNQPIEREGLLYAKDELRRYFELPDGTPDAIISVCDTKDRGSDDCVMPIAYVYGQNYYIEEIVCDNSNPEIVDELLIDALIRHKVQMSCFESNSAGGRVAQTVQAGVKARGGITKVETKYTTSNKETKIIVNSPWVKENCLFKDDTVSDRNYKRAIDKLCSYTTAGRNKKDDVVDAFAQLALYAETFGQTRIAIIKRPF